MRIARQKCRCQTRQRYNIKQSPNSRNMCGHSVVRWIGFAKRRTLELARRPTIEVTSARVIRLNWADTFGRPARVESTGIVRSIAAIVPFGPHSR